MDTVSHELRTPLTSIVGCAELLRDGDGGDLTDDQVRLVDAILHNSDRLEVLATKLFSPATPK